MIIVSSDAYREQSTTLAPFEEKCRTVPLGIDPDMFAEPDPAGVNRLKELYGGEFVLFSGKHRYYKGLEYLVSAASEISGPVVIAGNGPESEKLKKLASTARTKIHFPGELSHEELVNHLHGCSVFVFPSVARSEAYGLSMLEAHACGKPVVATRLGTGVEFVNADGETGLNIAPRDSSALAAAVNRLLTNRDEAAAYGARARERVTESFHARDVAKREYDLYQEAIECSTAGT